MNKSRPLFGRTVVRVTSLLILTAVVLIAVKSMTREAFADVAAELEQAQAYQQGGQYSQAEQICRDVIRRNPSRNHVFQAMKDLTDVYISWGKEKQAKEACQQLLRNFPQHPDLPVALHDIAMKYERSNFSQSIKYKAAVDVYQQLMDRYPDRCNSTLGEPHIDELDELHIEKLKIWSFIEAADSSNAQVAINAYINDPNFYERSDFPVVLHTIADRYEWSAFKPSIIHEVTTSLYKWIIQGYPDHFITPTARLNLAKMNTVSLIVESADEASAQTAINNLIADFADHPDLPRVLHSIATRYEWSGFEASSKYRTAKDLYKKIAKRSADSWYIERARLNIRKVDIWSLIESSDDNAAQEAIKSLIADFDGHSDLPVALDTIATKYEWQGKYPEAKDIFEIILNQYPDHWIADRAKTDVPKINIILLIESGEYAAAQAELDNFITEFSENSRLPMAVFEIGDHFYTDALEEQVAEYDQQAREYFEKAVLVWEKIIQQLPESPAAVLAYHLSANSYCYLGQYGKAIEYYEQVITNWPDYEYAWHLQFLVGRCYQTMKKSGFITDSEADSKTRAAYEELLKNYPDCKAAGHAKWWMARHNSI